MRRPEIFNEGLGIVEKMERYDTLGNFKLGDCLNRMVPVGTSGRRDGSYERLSDFSEFLEEHGYDYTVGRLVQIRITAERFDKKRRYPDLSFSVHEAAGYPDELDEFVRSAPKDRRISVSYIRNAQQAKTIKTARQLELERVRRQQLGEAARRHREEAEEARRKAATIADRQAAERRIEAANKEIRANSLPPKVGEIKVTLTRQEMPDLLAKAMFDRDLSEIVRGLHDLRTTHADTIKRFDKIEAEAAAVQLRTLAQEARELAEEIERQGNGNRFTVVA